MVGLGPICCKRKCALDGPSFVRDQRQNLSGAAQLEAAQGVRRLRLGRVVLQDEVVEARWTAAVGEAKDGLEIGRGGEGFTFYPVAAEAETDCPVRAKSQGGIALGAWVGVEVEASPAFV